MEDKIFKITRDKERANDLFVMAQERLEIIKILPKDKSYKIIEEYYEIMKELITALMYLDGYKTLSHKKLIEYFEEKNKNFDKAEIQLIDTLKKFRNEIVYYGKQISDAFLKNNEKEITLIIKKLINLTKIRLK